MLELTRTEKESIVSASSDSDLLETLVGLVALGAHDRYMCDRPNRDELVEQFSVTRGEILKRMGAASRDLN